MVAPNPNPNTLTLTLTSLTLQVVADEIREGQAAYQKKWEKETRGMREHLSINQKRLFLLEQEKNQLQQTASASESLTGVLRDQVRVRGRVWVRVRVGFGVWVWVRVGVGVGVRVRVRVRIWVEVRVRARARVTLTLASAHLQLRLLWRGLVHPERVVDALHVHHHLEQVARLAVGGGLG